MHRCEAMVMCEHTVNGSPQYVQCGRTPAELHHKLTRARGGLLLDTFGETYHHMRLCREHHAYAHDKPGMIEAGLLIEGWVTSDADGQPVYVGPDEYLKEKYH